MIRDQFRRWSEEKVVPFAHGWHERDELIPMAIIEEMAELGVFGLTIPEEFGGLGMGKLAMCVVTEELSARLHRRRVPRHPFRDRRRTDPLGGTDDQKAHYLPKLASGEILPTAVFTEPNTGSDLGSLRTRAVKNGDVYKVTGNKTWITHAARTDMMTLLARTNPERRATRASACSSPRSRAAPTTIPSPPGMTGARSRCSAIAA
jgi:(2S)-methylsuccinyl-CoA dehydrogenase